MRQNWEKESKFVVIFVDFWQEMMMRSRFEIKERDLEDKAQKVSDSHKI